MHTVTSLLAQIQVLFAVWATESRLRFKKSNLESSLEAKHAPERQTRTGRRRIGCTATTSVLVCAVVFVTPDFATVVFALLVYTVVVFAVVLCSVMLDFEAVTIAPATVTLDFEMATAGFKDVELSFDSGVSSRLKWFGMHLQSPS